MSTAYFKVELRNDIVVTIAMVNMSLSGYS